MSVPVTAASLNTAATTSTNSSATDSTALGAAAGQQLGQGDFMNLLMAQMKNQDPMDPVKDTDFVAQLAQFSQLSGITQLNTSISSMLLMQGLTQGTNMIGKDVTYSKDGTGTNTAEGTVDAVAVKSGQVQLVIDGTPVALSNVQLVQ